MEAWPIANCVVYTSVNGVRGLEDVTLQPVNNKPHPRDPLEREATLGIQTPGAYCPLISADSGPCFDKTGPLAEHGERYGSHP